MDLPEKTLQKERYTIPMKRSLQGKADVHVPRRRRWKVHLVTISEM